EREAEALPVGLRSEVEGLGAGINAGARDRARPGQVQSLRRGVAPVRARFRVEFQLRRLGLEPFTPADSLTLTKLLSFGLSTNWERELLRAEMARELGTDLAARLYPGYPRGNPVVLGAGVAWEGDGLGLAEQIAKVRGTIGLTA